MGFVGLTFLAAVALYFLPTILGRGKHNVGAIFTLNLLLGWTVVGWVVALIWALTAEAPMPELAGDFSSQAAIAPAHNSVVGVRYCTGCGNLLQSGHRYCARCGMPA